MDYEVIMEELEKLGNAQTKKTHMNHGAREPLFGVTVGAMKPLAKKYKGDQVLAGALYSTGNYDAMYFAGMIAEPKEMYESDFDRWMEGAYFHGISDYIVSVTLAETPYAQEVADRYIASGKDLYMSAGWSCYCWLIGNRADEEFDEAKIKKMLLDVEKNIHNAPNRTKYSMNNFVSSVGISYLPLHEEAKRVANAIGEVYVDVGATNCKVPSAAAYIQKTIDRDRVGFKRKHVRC